MNRFQGARYVNSASAHHSTIIRSTTYASKISQNLDQRKLPNLHLIGLSPSSKHYATLAATGSSRSIKKQHEKQLNLQVSRLFCWTSNQTLILILKNWVLLVFFMSYQVLSCLTKSSLVLVQDKVFRTPEYNDVEVLNIFYCWIPFQLHHSLSHPKLYIERRRKILLNLGAITVVFCCR